MIKSHRSLDAPVVVIEGTELGLDLSLSPNDRSRGLALADEAAAQADGAYGQH